MPSEASASIVAAVSVSIRGVSKTFGSVRAVVSASAEFAAARVSVIVGSNGSGKTTLLHIVGALARPTAGEVLHGGRALSSAQVRERLGWVGHDTMCYGDLSGWENIALAAQLRGLDAASSCEAARARFGLGSFADRPVRTLSRGQRQRVALARALVHAPSLVLLDEPTTGLDADGVSALAGVVRGEAQRGATVVVVTHDPAFAADVADARFAMAKGRLSAQG